VTGLYTTPGGATSEPRAFPREFAFQGMALSPNGRQLALISYSNDAVMVMDTSGGPPRELFRATATADENQSQVGFGMVTWSVDGQHILVTKYSGRSGENELWRVPAEGGEAVKLGSGLPDFKAIHPDGRQIVYMIGERESEVWVMENFLPIDGLQTSSARR
jgi:Tol biopolymer transport system component